MAENSSNEPLDEPFQPGYSMAPSPFRAFDATERWCLRCNSRLYQDGPSACPDCGLQYDGGNPETYRNQPMFLRWKFWFPGMATAIVCGVLSYAICLQVGELGLALFAAVPVSMGAILGYATRVRQWGLPVVVLMLSATVIMTVIGLIAIGAAGVFCGMMLLGIFAVPIAGGFFVGMLAGNLVRRLLANSSWDQRWFLPLIGFIALPYAAQLIENVVRPPLEPAVVRTRVSIHATPEEAWNAIVFYEDVEHEPPWLLRLALPRPVGSQGAKEQVGDVVRCQYEHGFIVKRITQVEPGRLLAFEVLEQELGAERNVTLLDGAFEIIPRADGRSDLMLTTRYQRHLAPKWLWEPAERKVTHTLHGHVLEGMRRKILQDRQEKPKPADPSYDRKTPSTPAA